MTFTNPSTNDSAKAERLAPLPPGAQPVGSVAAGTQERVAGTQASAPGVGNGAGVGNGTVTTGPVSNPLTLRHEAWRTWRAWRTGKKKWDPNKNDAFGDMIFHDIFWD